MELASYNQNLCRYKILGKQIIKYVLPKLRAINIFYAFHKSISLYIDTAKKQALKLLQFGPPLYVGKI